MKSEKQVAGHGELPYLDSTASNAAEKNSESEHNHSFHSAQRKAGYPSPDGLSEAALLRCADSNEGLMYAKVFAQIFDSSIADDYQLRHFFMDLLVLADLNGVVDMTQSAIAARTRMPLESVRELLVKLESPDPESRTTTAQGARIAKLDEHRSWGWVIINYDKFRKTASEEQRREKTKARTKKWRDGDAPVTLCDAGDAMHRQNEDTLSESVPKLLTQRELAEAIYDLYPRKVGKPDALRAILSQLKQHSFDLLRDSSATLAQMWSGHDMTYLAYPATWFNQQRFNDDPSTWGPKLPTQTNGQPPRRTLVEQELEAINRQVNKNK